MSPVLTLFILPTCPYCKQVIGWMEELKSDDPKYRAIEVSIINEKEEPTLAAQHDYYYVPTYFIGSTKVHEGAASKEIVRKVFDQYLNLS